MWVRGLKLCCSLLLLQVRAVAPRVGAWIETLISVICYNVYNESHPVWVRGLKLYEAGKKVPYNLYVAPRVGAWIETLDTRVTQSY